MSTELVWFKSSYSGTGGGDCVEVALAWKKSTYSGTEGGACVEVATCPDTVHVRDSKLKDGPELTLPAPSWARFVAYATRG
ncbi:DUF397 domain-containing protein [Streptomyces sp. Wb2n-11]|uniref:DUF397 domain-containing protein n=1 Tax=Streptomyces sp. Wb2n-11 TaxID=1030533 RepID=UPI000AB154B0|nr:DUF397 domain-containing protein [Streptomyces sp. Wb2n-11]